MITWYKAFPRDGVTTLKYEETLMTQREAFMVHAALGTMWCLDLVPNNQEDSE